MKYKFTSCSEKFKWYIEKNKHQKYHYARNSLGSSLKVQDKPLNKKTIVKYLRDHVNKTVTVKATVEERQGKALRISAQILSMATCVLLWQWRMQSGAMLRTSMLINGTLYNCCKGSDADKEIKTLNKPNQALLCGPNFRNSKVPLASWSFCSLNLVVFLCSHPCLQKKTSLSAKHLKKDQTELLS